MIVKLKNKNSNYLDDNYLEIGKEYVVFQIVYENREMFYSVPYDVFPPDIDPLYCRLMEASAFEIIDPRLPPNYVVNVVTENSDYYLMYIQPEEFKNMEWDQYNPNLYIGAFGIDVFKNTLKRIKEFHNLHLDDAYPLAPSSGCVA